MAGLGEITVKLDLKILEESEKARELIRMLIRDELKVLLREERHDYRNNHRTGSDSSHSDSQHAD